MPLVEERPETALTEPPHRLHPRVVAYWWLVAGGRLCLGLTLLTPLVLAIVPAGVWLGAIAPAVLVLGMVVAFGLARARYARFRFVIDDHMLCTTDGVLVHEEKIIPVARMQHVDIRRGPLERLLGIASLTVFTAGGYGAGFYLQGLEPEKALLLRSKILSMRGALGSQNEPT